MADQRSTTPTNATADKAGAWMDPLPVTNHVMEKVTPQATSAEEAEAKREEIFVEWANDKEPGAFRRALGNAFTAGALGGLRIMAKARLNPGYDVLEASSLFVAFGERTAIVDFVREHLEWLREPGRVTPDELRVAEGALNAVLRFCEERRS